MTPDSHGHDVAVAQSRYQRVKDIYYQTTEKPPAAREAFVDQVCNGDQVLRSEVMRLLAAPAEFEAFLEQPAVSSDALREVAMASIAEAATAEPLPERIGRYRILRLVGEGGMGCVYEAQQDSPQRRVALKVLRAGMGMPRVLQRFQQEVEVLGRLQHPGIARIYDAGVADVARGEGRSVRVPFFAMEFIDGRPITHYAAEHHLEVSQRLELLARVCDAVHFGHQQGVIHRDLKPANILVIDDLRLTIDDPSTGDREPARAKSSIVNGQSSIPKIIDFGVARATNADIAITTLHTDAGQILGTLAYMSPEQVRGDASAIDARCDVYALGVLGYELLAGRLPYDVTGKVVPEAARIIRDEEPSRLSSISRVFRGDIETIFAKALEKEPVRRYESAAALAADIRRYLHDEPIIARPPTLRYQLGKFARRHKELVAGLALVFIVLVAGLVVSISEMVRAETAEANAITQMNKAVKQQRQAEAASAFMRRVLTFTSPWAEGGGRELKIADMLDAAAGEVDDLMKDQPELEMQARQLLGEAYLALGLYSEAEAQFTRALERVWQLNGKRSLEALHIMDRIAWCKMDSWGFIGSNQTLADSAVAEARAIADAGDPTLHNLLFTAGCASHWNGSLDDAYQSFRELCDALAKISSPNHGFSASDARFLLGRVECQRQNWDEGLREVRHALEADATNDPFRMLARHAGMPLPFILDDLGFDKEAEQWFTRTLAVQERVLGEDHGQTLATMHNYGVFLIRTGRYQEALEIRERQLPYSKRDESNGHVAMLHGHVGQLHALLGRDEAAARAFVEAIAWCRRPASRSDALAQAWWREGVIRLGMGLHKPWASEALRMQCCRLIDDALRAGPTARFDLNEIDWSAFHFELKHWRADTSDAAPALVPMASGSLEEFRQVPELEPGADLLSLEAPRSGAPAIETSAWMLASPWELDLYRAWNYTTQNAERWRSMLDDEPRERRSVPALALANWWEAGFGPANFDTYFGIVATTQVDLPPGQYRVVVWADDGVRLWIDGQPLIDAWVDRAWAYALKYEAAVNLAPGVHDIRVEYNQIVGDGRLWVRLEPFDAIHSVHE